jgi:hypothetical protein
MVGYLTGVASPRRARRRGLAVFGRAILGRRSVRGRLRLGQCTVSLGTIPTVGLAMYG